MTAYGRHAGRTEMLDNAACVCKQREAILASMDANAARSARGLVLRSEPDTTRPTVSTAVAAARYGLSRYYVAELVRQGKIDGYGVRRHEGGRIRWYVYADALPDESQDSARVRASGGAQELLRHLLDAREHARHGRDERGSAQRLLMDLVDALTNALRAAKEGDSSHTIDLLLVAHEIRNDEKRRLLRAEQHEADAEACLDEALRGLLQLGGEVESHAQDGASSTSCREVTARGTRERRGSV